MAAHSATCFSGLMTSSAPLRRRNLAWTSLSARATTSLPPSSFSRDVVSKELWKSPPMVTMHTSKLATPNDRRKAALVLSPIWASVTKGRTLLIRASFLSTAMT